MLGSVGATIEQNDRRELEMGRQLGQRFNRVMFALAVDRAAIIEGSQIFYWKATTKPPTYQAHFAVTDPAYFNLSTGKQL